MALQSISEIVREAEDNFINGSTTLGKYVDFSTHDTLERIDAYLNSKHITGEIDSLNREKPFFNIVSSAVNVWYRATDIDRKDIKFVPTADSAVVLAFIANVMLQNWMDENRFGSFLNKWGRELARYGSAVVKFVEQGGELLASVTPWNRVIPDTVDFDAQPHIEKFYRTPAQLRKNKLYDQEKVSALIDSQTTRKTLDGQQKDNLAEFIELYEVSGEMDERLLEDNPDLNIEDTEIKYRQQMHVVSFVETEKDKFDDFTLFNGKQSQEPSSISSLIDEDGRTLGIGAVEYLFDAQWMQNHTVKNMKDTLDLASKLIFQTSDQRYVGRNVLTTIETGDIFVHAKNEPLTRVANDKPDITAMQNFGVMWQNLAQELTNTPDLSRGITQASPVTFGLGKIMSQNTNSLFEIMIENKGLAIEDMMRNHVIPFLKKKLKNKDQVVGILDDAGIAEIDSRFVPRQAIRNFNKRGLEALFNGEIPQPFDQAQEEGAVAQQLGTLGDKRFFKPDELGKKQWNEVFNDFQWDNIRVEVTNENVDKEAIFKTLTAVFQTLANLDPAKAQDPNMKAVLSAILRETGQISPIQLSTVSASPAAPVGNALEQLSEPNKTA